MIGNTQEGLRNRICGVIGVGISLRNSETASKQVYTAKLQGREWLKTLELEDHNFYHI